MELLIIGIDALDPRILIDNIDKFPNMKKLILNGVFSDYFGYADGYGSNDNWISLYTGLEPERHGVLNNRYIATDERPQVKHYIDKKTFWELLNKEGKSVGLWRGLAISPVYEIDGYMIGGAMNFEFDKEIENEDLQVLKNNILYNQFEEIRKINPVKKLKNKEDLELEVKECLSFDNYYEDGLKYFKYELDYFLNNITKAQDINPVDLLFYYTPTLDLIQHMQQYDPDRRIIIESMVELDNFIGQIKKKLDPKNIIVISDHGSSSFNDMLGRGNRELEEEAFGLASQAVWLDNGQIVIKARNGGILSGIHDVKATFIANGEKFKENHHIKDMRNIDFYPTLLEFFDIKVPYGRNGYVLDVFKDKKIVNKDMIYPKDHKVKDILLIQNIEVYNFNKSLNQLFLNNRFSDITILCEKKYKEIFSLNPRIDNIITYEDKINIKNYINNYDEIYIPSIRTEDKKISYLRLI